MCKIPLDVERKAMYLEDHMGIICTIVVVIGLISGFIIGAVLTHG